MPFVIPEQTVISKESKVRRPIEVAWYEEEMRTVEVVVHGAHVSMVTWVEAPGVMAEAWVDNSDLDFEDDDTYEV